MNQKNKYLILDALSRGSKWHMGYGSVLLCLGGVWIQSPNQRLPYKFVDLFPGLIWIVLFGWVMVVSLVANLGLTGLAIRARRLSNPGML